MASTYTNILRLELQADGENDGTWGQILNDNVIALIEDAVSATTSISTTGGTTTLSTNQGSTDQARNAMLDVTGSLGSNALIEVPAQSKHYIVRNNTSGSFTVEVLVSGQSAGAGVVVPQGAAQWVYCDGSDVHPAAAPIEQDGDLPSLSVSGSATVNGSATFNGTLVHSSTGATQVASGASGDRPGTPTTGDFRHSSTLGAFEGYDGSQWLEFLAAQVSSVLQKGVFANPTSLSISSNQTAINARDSHIQTLTINADTEIQVPTNQDGGFSILIVATNDSTGGYNLTFASGYTELAGSQNYDDAANAVNIIQIIGDGTNVWYNIAPEA